MAWIADAQLAGAISKAGGAGVIAAGGRDPNWLRDEMHKIKFLTNKPFGVNIVLMDTNKEALMDVVCEEKAAFVTLSAGNPVPYIDKFKKEQIKTFAVVPNAKLAHRLEDVGADAVIIEGMEAGGHIGKLTTLALMTNVIPEISIPVIVAGGIADGRGIAAALLMGASGVQIGSRFLTSEECPVHPNFKQRIIDAQDTDSVVTGYFTKHVVRGLRCKFTDKFLKMEREGATVEEMDRFATGTSRLSAVDGDVENGMVQVGQSLHPLKSIQPANEIIHELMCETERVLSGAFALLNA